MQRGDFRSILDQPVGQGLMVGHDTGAANDSARLFFAPQPFE
jgi:hypothetical protein